MVLHYCLKNDIEFINQTFPQFIKRIWSCRNFTRNLTTIIKPTTTKMQCLKRSTKQNECDHIRPLANGGDNEIINLQLLCKSCHADKCKLEHEDVSYVKIVDTESSFKKKTNEIIHNVLNKHLAFTEKLSDEPEEFIEVDST